MTFPRPGEKPEISRPKSQKKTPEGTFLSQEGFTGCRQAGPGYPETHMRQISKGMNNRIPTFINMLSHCYKKCFNHSSYFLFLSYSFKLHWLRFKNKQIKHIQIPRFNSRAGEDCSCSCTAITHRNKDELTTTLASQLVPEANPYTNNSASTGG